MPREGEEVGGQGRVRALCRRAVAEKLARNASTWRSVAARVDLARSTGLVHGLQTWRRDRLLGRLAPRRRQRLARALWVEAAAELGAELVQLAPNQFEIRLGGAVTRIRGQTVSLNDPEAAKRAGDKPHMYRLLADSGLPVPEHQSFRPRGLAGGRDFLSPRAPPGRR